MALPSTGDTMTTEQLVALIGVPIIGGLATAVTVLYKQLLKQQKQFEGILREAIQCLGTWAELQRQTNNLLIEVKDTVLKCKRANNDGSNDCG